MLQDIRCSLRALTRDKRSAILCVAVLAAGIGLNAALFSAAYAVLWKALPVSRPDTLCLLSEQKLGFKGTVGVAPGNFADWRARTRTFSDIAGFSTGTSASREGAAVVELPSASVTPNVFPLIGSRVALGRGFRESDEGAHLVVISDAYWRARFDRSPAALGKTLILKETPYTIIGVMAPGVVFPYPYFDEKPLIWRLESLKNAPGQRLGRYLSVLGRLAPGSTISQARAEMNAIAQEMERENPATNKGWRVSVTAFREELAGSTGRTLRLLALVAGLVLLLACANVACVILARSFDQRGEAALRLALGAGRFRLVRQILADSLVLSVIACVCAAILAAWLIPASQAALMKMTPYAMLGEMRLDWRALSFASGLGILTTVLCAMLPAAQLLRADLSTPLRAANRSYTASRSNLRWHRALVVIQVAMATVLVSCALVFVANVLKLMKTPTSCDPGNLLTAKVSVPLPKYLPYERRVRFYYELAGRLGQLPGVLSASAAKGVTPGTSAPEQLEPAKQQGGCKAGVNVSTNGITPEYFRTLSLPVIRGRVFNHDDQREGAHSAIVSESVARLCWSGADPIGAEVYLRPNRERYAVVGVAQDQYLLGTGRPALEVYVMPEDFATNTLGLLVRTADRASNHANDVLAAVKSIDPAIDVKEITPMDQLADGGLARPRLYASITLGLAGIAILLSAIGLYGAISYSVARRHVEFGVRMALGAAPLRLFIEVLAGNLKTALAGVVIGAAATLELMPWVKSYSEASAGDASIIFTAVAAIAFAGLAASYFPARSAAHLDTANALRGE